MKRTLTALCLGIAALTLLTGCDPNPGTPDSQVDKPVVDKPSVTEPAKPLVKPETSTLPTKDPGMSPSGPPSGVEGRTNTPTGVIKGGTQVPNPKTK